MIQQRDFDATPLGIAIENGDIESVRQLALSPVLDQEYPDAIPELAWKHTNARTERRGLLREMLKVLGDAGLRVTVDCQPRASHWKHGQYTLVGNAVRKTSDVETLTLALGSPSRIFLGGPAMT
jgi:hypothetical protein